MQSIPKKLHFIWVGDEKLAPLNCIETWQEAHPAWTVQVWDNAAWEAGAWINKHHMEHVASTGQLRGVADMMRWEILLNEGGIAIDADCVCLQALPEWLLGCEIFACWENEVARPGLISNGLLGAKQGNPVLGHIVEKLYRSKNIADRFVWYKLKKKKQSSWKATGPLALTKALHETRYNDFTILPSHFSIPLHYSGRVYRGDGPVYCSQLFTGTGSGCQSLQYKTLLQLSSDELKEKVINELRESKINNKQQLSKMNNKRRETRIKRTLRKAKVNKELVNAKVL